MTPRQKRIWMVVGIVGGVGLAATLALQAFQDNLMYFQSPTQVLEQPIAGERSFRLGGLVEPGSVTREPGNLEVRFRITDNVEAIEVSYAGLLPDLFREGQGVIVRGKLGADGLFVAEEVLAKHDENYMPPEVAESLRMPPLIKQVEAGGA